MDMASPITWKIDVTFWSPNRAEHALTGRHELVAFDLPEVNGCPRVIGWEVFGGAPRFLDMIAKGELTFEEAKQAAEAALEKLQAVKP
jgi:hypothetical protein